MTLKRGFFCKKPFKRLFLVLIFAAIISIVTTIYCTISSDMIPILKRNQIKMEHFLSNARSEYALLYGNETTQPAPQQKDSNLFNYLEFRKDEVKCGQLVDSEKKEISNPHDFSKLLLEWKKLSRGKFDTLTIYFQENGLMRASFIHSGKWKSYAEGNYKYNDMLIWYDEYYPESPKTSWQPRLERKSLYYESPPGRRWVQLLTKDDGITTSTGGDWYYSSAKQYDG